MLDPSRADLVAGVAGSGTMGRGIAQVLAQSGVRTLVFDAQPGAAHKARESIGRSLGKLVERGKLDAAAVEATLGRIEVAGNAEAFKPCHVVVEAIVEDLQAKRELFARLEGIVAGNCILASNTSSLSVTAMAAACQRPQRVAGYHFFNPVPVMKIVEVVDARIQSGFTTFSSAEKSWRLADKSSTIASTTRWEGARPSTDSTISSRRRVLSTSPAGMRPFSTSLPRLWPIESRAFCAAPGWLSNTRVRTPHCARTCAMPRPMVPVPATPATRSLRLESSKPLF